MGQRTLADLAQAQSRLARAQAQLKTAESTLNTTKANFERVVGLEPVDLEFPDDAGGLPQKLEDAINLAIRENLDVKIADANISSAKADIVSNQGTRLPTLALSTTFSRNRTSTRGPTIDSTEESVAATMTLTVPIYQNGSEFAKVRAARKTLLQRKLEWDNTRLAAKEAVIQNWGSLQSALANISSYTQEAESARVARTNIAAELEIGRRTVLNLLDAEKEVLDAEVNLVGARRDAIVVGYTILGALGRLNAANLRLPVQLYDPEADFKSVKFNVFSTSVD